MTERSFNLVVPLAHEATHSHHDRASLANLLRSRGHCVKADMTKIYRTKEQAR